MVSKLWCPSTTARYSEQLIEARDGIPKTRRRRGELALHLLLVLPLLVCCRQILGIEPLSPDSFSLELLVEDYESGQIDREQYLSELEVLGGRWAPETLSGTLSESRLLDSDGTVVVIEDGFRIAPDAILVIAPGQQLEVSFGASVDVDGRIYAVGRPDAKIEFQGNAYSDIILSSGPNRFIDVVLTGGEELLRLDSTDEPTLIEDAYLDSWSLAGIVALDAANLTVRGSLFGATKLTQNVSGEAIRTDDSGTIRIEDSTFANRGGRRDVIELRNCKTSSWSFVLRNVFEGGGDDAVDLEDCNAFLVGNIVENFVPPSNVAGTGINGGGLTGGGQTTALIANNLIRGCFHAVGFRDGARPYILHNTIVDNNIGITLFQSAVGVPMPHGVVTNNILADNLDWNDSQPHDIVLNGKWWPTFNQVDEIQATVDATYNITSSGPDPFIGEGNLASDPAFAGDGDFHLLLASPAIDSGQTVLELPTTQEETALEFLSRDLDLAARLLEGASLVAPDRGAYESQ